jgi:hypothetical protein
VIPNSSELTLSPQVSSETIHSTIREAREKLRRDARDQGALIQQTVYEYYDSWGLRGDNRPESAEYLGYLNFKDLYPEVRGKSIRDLFQQVLQEGRVAA